MALSHDINGSHSTAFTKRHFMLSEEYFINVGKSLPPSPVIPLSLRDSTKLSFV